LIQQGGYRMKKRIHIITGITSITLISLFTLIFYICIDLFVDTHNIDFVYIFIAYVGVYIYVGEMWSEENKKRRM